MPRLKYVQSEILIRILQQVKVHEAAHGFVSEKSIVSNALPHLQSEVVINMDLKDFFPTITYDRVKGVFRSLGYSQQVATILALICSEQTVESVELDGETWFVADGERRLPQGAPTSPMITNILCRHLDKRLAGLANKLGFRYTRYADDLTFSAHRVGNLRSVEAILRKLLKEIKSPSLKINEDKTVLATTKFKRMVTGLILTNEKTVSIGHERKRKIRAAIHNYKAGKLDLADTAHLAGLLAFVNDVEPEHFSKLLQKYGTELIRGIKLTKSPQPTQ